MRVFGKRAAGGECSLAIANSFIGLERPQQCWLTMMLQLETVLVAGCGSSSLLWTRDHTLGVFNTNRKRKKTHCSSCATHCDMRWVLESLCLVVMWLTVIVACADQCRQLNPDYSASQYFNLNAMSTDATTIANLTGSQWDLARDNAFAKLKLFLCLATPTSFSQCPSTGFVSAIQEKGFQVYQSCNMATQLSYPKYHVFILFDRSGTDGYASNPTISVADAQTIAAFYKNGGGIYSINDNCGLLANVNRMLSYLPTPLSLLQMRYNDLVSPFTMNHGNPLTGGMFGGHDVFTGMSQMVSGGTLAVPYYNGVQGIGPFVPIATITCNSVPVTCSGDAISATYVASHAAILSMDPLNDLSSVAGTCNWGRMILDLEFGRYCYMTSREGSFRFATNVASWLVNIGRVFESHSVTSTVSDADHTVSVSASTEITESVSRSVSPSSPFRGTTTGSAVEETASSSNLLSSVSKSGSGACSETPTSDGSSSFTTKRSLSKGLASQTFTMTSGRSSLSTKLSSASSKLSASKTFAGWSASAERSSTMTSGRSSLSTKLSTTQTLLATYGSSLSTTKLSSASSKLSASKTFAGHTWSASAERSSTITGERSSLSTTKRLSTSVKLSASQTFAQQSWSNSFTWSNTRSISTTPAWSCTIPFGHVMSISLRPLASRLDASSMEYFAVLNAALQSSQALEVEGRTTTALLVDSVPRSTLMKLPGIVFNISIDNLESARRWVLSNVTLLLNREVLRFSSLTWNTVSWTLVEVDQPQIGGGS
ncbi:Hypothetical protein, putative, partial [Bodo saltans]